MCGFAGILEPTTSTPLLETASRMAATLAHRGPDDHDTWADVEQGIALGFRRLSVIDLSPAGRQPMVSASGRFVIAFNGEVYNAPLLRRDLEAAGTAPTFRGHSDTETMLAGIEAWGLEEAVRRFIGMFAFALWDHARRELSLVRDRFGVKPLCYQHTPQGIAFASELRALRVHPRFDPTLDRGAMALFLRLGYIPAPHTIYAAARKVEPATIMTIPADRPSEARTSRYWSVGDLIDRGNADPLQLSDEQLLARVEDLLDDAVGLRMAADVPLGVFLSGGVDSSLVAALAQRRSTRPVRTFSIGFEDPRLDESGHARAVSDHLGTQHTAFAVSEADALAVVHELPEIYDEPFADSSQIPTYLVSRLARAEVTVALTGDGGDEMFAGYDRYRWIGRVAKALAPVPGSVRRGFAQAIRGMDVLRLERWHATISDALPRGMRMHNLAGKLAKVASLAESPTAGAMYFGLMSHTSEPTALLPGAAEPGTIFTDTSAWPKSASVADQAIFLDLMSYLPDDLLVKVDRASMAVGLEAREPLLDHRLFELSSRVPMSQRIRGTEGKWPLRAILQRHVPRNLVDRPKMGFGVPLNAWLLGPLRSLADSHLERTDTDRRVWRELQAGRSEVAGLTWNLLVLRMWLARHAPSESPFAVASPVRSAEALPQEAPRP